MYRVKISCGYTQQTKVPRQKQIDGGRLREASYKLKLTRAHWRKIRFGKTSASATYIFSL